MWVDMDNKIMCKKVIQVETISKSTNDRFVSTSYIMLYIRFDSVRGAVRMERHLVLSKEILFFFKLSCNA